MSFLVFPRSSPRVTVLALCCLTVALSCALFGPRASQAGTNIQPAEQLAWPAQPRTTDASLDGSFERNDKEARAKERSLPVNAKAKQARPAPASRISADWRSSRTGAAEEQTFVVYRNEKGRIACRNATADEHSEIVARKAGGETRIIYSGAPRKTDLPEGTKVWKSEITGGLTLAPSSGLKIVLHATNELTQNQTAKNAFIVAANRWEVIISTPITVVIDVDFGPTFFGQPYPDPSIIGATGTDIVVGPYPDLRQRLVNSASTPAEQQIYNALPASTIPVELDGIYSNETSVELTAPNARALGIVPDITDPDSLSLGQGDAGIGFNSAFEFDFDPTDGVSAGLTDFDAVAAHEIGHALGFISGAGANRPAPVSILDLFRFRPSIPTIASFPTTPRIMSLGGGQIFFNNELNTFGTFELGLSTGGPNPGPNSGDRRQSSHWRDDGLQPSVPYIGLMDPTLDNGLRRTISENDIIAMDTFGYSIAVYPLVRPVNNDFINAITLQTNSGTVNGNSVNATREGGEPLHAGFLGDKSIWYSWTSAVNGQITIDTIGSGFDTTLGVYTGTAVYQLSNIASNDDIANGSNKASRVQFNITAGTAYRIAVDGWNGEYGNVTLNWSATGVVPTPTPTPTPTPSPTPSPTPTPTPPCFDDTWTATSTTDAPLPRAYHTAVWTGTEMIIWGGMNGSSYLNSGGRYNPVTNTWRPTTAVNVPLARAGHTAVWTGTEMIIWGGINDAQGYLKDGSRYNPVTDTWTTITVVNTPTPRRDHCAVWTGSEMIVWGGFKDIVLNTGGRYNPTTDSWTATTLSNAADGRTTFTATWTGNEMMVWGGQGSQSQLQSGGRYNPATDTWAPATSTVAAPSRRRDQTAIWDGSEMIIWGGNPTFDVDQRNTGARYKPASDSWTATTMNNVPAARAYNTAVWSGDEMIVWGGGPTNVSTTYNDGGRYNPVTNTWISTCGTNAPARRKQATGVWTGREMIVWGGSDINSFNTGGRYRIEAPTLQLVLDSSGPVADQAAALDSLLFLRDAFPVHNGFDLLNLGSDRNTRIILLVTNLRPATGEAAGATVVSLVESNNQTHDIPAEDVRVLANTNFTQVTFRLPDNVAVGTCTIKVNAHGQVTNAGTIRVQ